jgi:hypothetical protein
MVEYSDLVHAYLPSGSSAFQSADIVIDAYLGARVFGLAVDVDDDDFGVNWRTWVRNGRLLVGDNKYLHDTLIDEFVTEKTWTGGDLALKYGWDEDVDFYLNNSAATPYDGNVFKRGSITPILNEIGYKVQLFDNGTTADNAADNDRVGKIVVVREDLAQVTRVDNNLQTINLKLFNGSVQGLALNAYPTDNTFAVNDYVAVVLRYDGIEDDNEDGIWADWATTGHILRVVKAESVEIKSTSYSRNTNVMGVERLATVTSDSAEKYIFDSWYRFGIGTLPNFDGNALLILDSNGRVIGFSGDVAGPAAYKYVYVSGIYVTPAINGFTAPRAQARVHNVATGASRTVDLAVTKATTGAYQITINNAKINLTDNNGSVAGGAISVGSDNLVAAIAATGKTYGSDNLYGWWYYTSADDADTITLRNPQLASNATQHSISTGLTSTSSANTYGVGTVADVSAQFARPISAGITIPNTGYDFGPVYADSKTVFYYRGVKYTGYANLPLTVAGDVLVVKGSDNVVDVVHIYGDVDLTAKLTTYAVISSQPTYEYISDGKITYREVMGTTAAITNAAPGGGVYEIVEPGETGNYHLGDIVRVKQVGSEWEIDSVVEPGAAPAAATDDAVIMHGYVQTYLGSYFIVSNGIPTVFITPTLPIFDKFAADFPIANPYPKTDVEVGYEVDVLVDFQGFGPVAAYAVIITSYITDPVGVANETARNNAIAAVTSATGMIADGAGANYGIAATDISGLNVSAINDISLAATEGAYSTPQAPYYDYSGDLSSLTNVVTPWVQALVKGGSQNYPQYITGVTLLSATPYAQTAFGGSAVDASAGSEVVFLMYSVTSENGPPSTFMFTIFGFDFADVPYVPAS